MASSITLIQGKKTDKGSELVCVDRDTSCSGYSSRCYITAYTGLWLSALPSPTCSATPTGVK